MTDLSRRGFLAGGLAGTSLASQAPARPNILWICTDQQRYDTIQALGNLHIRTPHLDRLAASGCAFTNAYCQATVCTPSRASFLTGVYPSTLHVNRNGNSHFPEQHARRLISHILAENGYYCGLIGKLHLAGAYNRIEPRVNDGYQFFRWSHGSQDRKEDSVDSNAYFQWLKKQGVAYRPGMDTRYQHSTWCAEEAIHFIQDATRPGTPWFLSVNMQAPHPPNIPPAEYLNRMDVESLPLPLFRKEEMTSQLAFGKVDHQTQRPVDPEKYPARRMKAAYYAEIELIDSQVGRIIEALESSAQRRNTIVVFSTDHGEMLGDHGLTQKGCRFYEGAVHVPLFFSWPDHFKAGLRSAALVELTDIAPTLLDAIKIEAPPDYLPQAATGRSLRAILTGAAAPGHHRDFVRCEYLDALDLPNHTHADMLFDGRYKLIVYHGLTVGELYDLGEDLHEFRNLWSEAGARSEKDRLMIQLFDAVRMASDPGQPRIGRF